MRRVVSNFSVTCVCVILASSISLVRAEDRIPDEQASGALPGRVAVKDIALTEQGELVGTLLDTNGSPIRGEMITLFRGTELTGRVATDASGNFRFENLSGGIFAVAAGEHVHVYRVWVPGTAPPTATRQAVIYSGSVVRGVHGKHGGAGGPGDGFIGGFNVPSIHPVQFLQNPWTIGALIGTAVAVPIILHDDEFAS